MKRLWLTACVLAVVSPLLADERVERLPEEDRAWLEEEVVYIITEQEREVFLTLSTMEERARFKEAFWRKRDPNRATAVNEFREEHYRRIEYANQYLGRETSREGWQTDRGRFHIILGEPQEVQRFDSDNELVESELWFYHGDASRGMPAFFYLLFFKKNDVGEYRLYRPLADGPSALLRSSQGMSGADNAVAVEMLQRISPELARASLTVGTRDSADYLGGGASLGSDIAIAQIEESPKRAVRTDYAEAHLRYGDRVSAEYSFNFVPSRSYFAVLAGPENTPFLHYSIELDSQDFSLETDETQSTFYTTLDVSLEIRGPEGKLIATNEKTLPLELTPSQVRAIGSAPVAYQDSFPVVPGPILASVIVRNRVLRQYTVAEREIDVPDFARGAPMLSDLVLGYGENITPEPVAPHEHRTFQIGPTRIEIASNETFVIGDVVYASVQAVSADPGSNVRFTLNGPGGTVDETETSLAHHDGGLVVAALSLAGVDGGRYDVRADLERPDGTTAFARSAPLMVSPRTSIARPGFVYRRGFNPRVPGLLPLAIGEQLWARGRRDEAMQRFQEAVDANNPRLPMARWRLAGAKIQAGRPDEAIELLAPLESAHGTQYEVIAGLGFAFHQKGDFEQAASYLARAATLRPPDTTHWNVLGDSYRRVGKLEDAKDAFRRSLLLDPDQDDVRAQMASLANEEGVR